MTNHNRMICEFRFRSCRSSGDSTHRRAASARTPLRESYGGGLRWGATLHQAHAIASFAAASKFEPFSPLRDQDFVVRCDRCIQSRSGPLPTVLTGNYVRGDRLRCLASQILG